MQKMYNLYLLIRIKKMNVTFLKLYDDNIQAAYGPHRSPHKQFHCEGYNYTITLMKGEKTIPLYNQSTDSTEKPKLGLYNVPV